MSEKIKELPLNQRPREKAYMMGIQTLSDTELLGVLLRTGTREKTCLDIASELLEKAQGLAGLNRLNCEELMVIKGISKVKAIELLASVELARRISYEKVNHKKIMDHPSLLVDWLKLELGDSVQERVMVLFLNTRLCMVGYETLFVGSQNQSVVDIKLVLKKALDRMWHRIVLVHNHPGGSLVPSQEDIDLTKRLQQCATLMDIEVVDHLIVSDEGYFSFKESEVL